jgi:hypothetical protein
MGFIKDDLTAVNEPKPASEGTYDLKIIKAAEKESKKGRDMIQLLIGFDDGTNAPPFNHFLMNPTDDDDENQRELRLLELKRFCSAFDTSEDFDASDLPGCSAHGIFVIQEEGDDGIIRNRMKLPRLKE